MSKGKFIVIEGLEGAGKTTARQTVVDELLAHGISKLVFTREPGGTPLAEILRDIIKQDQKNEVLTDKAELLLLYAARIQLVTHVIKPALARGEWVIGDRHELSTQAYQGGGRGMDVTLLNMFRKTILDDFSPDLTLYLDLPPELGLQRVRQRGKLDRIERESLHFFEKIRQRYLDLAREDPRIVLIDAAQSLEQVSMEIKQKLRVWLLAMEEK